MTGLAASRGDRYGRDLYDPGYYGGYGPIRSGRRAGRMAGRTAEGMEMEGNIRGSWSMQQKLDMLCDDLNMEKGGNIVETIDKGVEMIGLQKKTKDMNLAEKVDACFQTLGTQELESNEMTDLARRGDRYGRDRYGLGYYGDRYGRDRYDYGLGYYGGSGFYPGYYDYGAYGYGYGGYSPWAYRRGYGYGRGAYGYGYGRYGYGSWDYAPYGRGAYGRYGWGYGWGPYGGTRRYWELPRSDYYGYAGRRRAFLYDRAIDSWNYDPYQAIGYSWDAYCDFFY